jgi:uncharacterized OB-fold protein
MTLRFVDCTLPRPLPPASSAFTATFWEALGRGRLTSTRCEGCAELCFPPRPACPRCGSSAMRWVELSDRGRLYSRTRVHAAGGTFAAFAPYSVGIVDLDDGVRILTRLLPEASALPLDTAVQMVVLRHPDGPLFAAIAAR